MTAAQPKNELFSNSFVKAAWLHSLSVNEPKVIILIAEDDPNDVFLFRRALAQLGFEAHFVSNGTEVIDYISGAGPYSDRQEHPFPNALILDLKMPRMNGFEVLDWLRQNNSLAIIPTLVFSSSAAQEDIKRAYQFGANTYFVKPISLTELVDLFRKIVNYWCAAEIP